LNNLNNHDRKHAVGEGRGWEGRLWAGLSVFCRLEMLLGCMSDGFFLNMY